MALVVGTNSYISVADADDYFLTRLNSAKWTSSTPTDKENALITATTMIDCLYIFNGEKTDPAQPLEFPRDGATEIPDKIKLATCEQAFYLLSVGDVTIPSASAEGVKKATLGSMSVEYFKDLANAGTKEKLAPCLKYLLSQFGKAKAGVNTNGTSMCNGTTVRN